MSDDHDYELTFEHGYGAHEALSDSSPGRRGRYRGRFFGTQRDQSYGGEPPYLSDYSESWRRAGPYSGVGPRDYRRSDEQVAEEANERLTQHGYVDASDIRVQVQQGEITLSGAVPNRQMKRFAEAALETVPGMRDIHNQLRLQGLEPTPQRTGGQAEGAVPDVEGSGSADPIERRRPTQAEGDPKDI